MIAVFIASSVSLGVLIGVLLPRRELVAPIIMSASLPLIFTAGFIWPRELIPRPLLWLSELSPSTNAIQGFLKLNQMGAEFNLVLNHWFSLWGLFLLYSLCAYTVLRSQSQSE